MKLRIIQNLDLDNKTVLVRVDYNVPLNPEGSVADNARIRESIPTLEYLLERNCKLVLLSHLGRPDGQKKPEFSLAKVSEELSNLIQKPVTFVDDCLKPGLKDLISASPAGSIFLLENLRFYAEEEKNDPEFAKKLANLADCYVSDAFGAVHRKHASIYELAKLLPSAAGLLLQKEIQALGSVMVDPAHPFTLVAGGAKIETKLGLLEYFLPKTDYILLGGGLANTFLKAEGQEIGKSYHQDEFLNQAKTILENSNKKIVLPDDYIVTVDPINSEAKTSVKTPDQIIHEDQIVDLGPESLKTFSKLILDSKTVIWNGPVGVYEYEPMRTGTKAIVDALVQSHQNGNTIIVGGGDSLDALKLFNINNDNFTHVSTGGGAMLEFLEGKSLPGIEVLES